jgi:membrane associated rhomboid family serine protease
MNYSRNNGFLSNIPVVTRNLLLINAVVWLLCYLFRDLVGFLAVWGFNSGYFHIYQLVTYMFTHLEFTHLFFNMFALYMFGMVLENYWGPKRFLIYYMVTGIGAGIVQTLLNYNSVVPTIGASGSVFGILLAFGMIFPNAPLYLFFVPIPIKAKYMVFGYGLLELVYGVANRSGDNVAHFAHLAGMAFGIVMILYWRKNGNAYGYNRNNSIKSAWNKISGIFRKKNVGTKEYRRPETDLEYNARRAEETREIDKILDKIKFSGYDSLSEEEKRRLFEFGKRK